MDQTQGRFQRCSYLSHVPRWIPKSHGDNLQRLRAMVDKIFDPQGDSLQRLWNEKHKRSDLQVSSLPQHRFVQTVFRRQSAWIAWPFLCKSLSKRSLESNSSQNKKEQKTAFSTLQITYSKIALRNRRRPLCRLTLSHLEVVQLDSDNSVAGNSGKLDSAQTNVLQMQNRRQLAHETIMVRTRSSRGVPLLHAQK